MNDLDGTSSGMFILFPLEAVVNLIATIYSRMTRAMRATVRNRLQRIDREDQEAMSTSHDVAGPMDYPFVRPNETRRSRGSRDQPRQCGRQCRFFAFEAFAFSIKVTTLALMLFVIVFSALHLRGVDGKLNQLVIDE